MKKTVGIFIFNEVEVLDFAGPFEVFSKAENDGEKLFDVVTIGEDTALKTARNGLLVKPGHDFKDAPECDILIIPGGYGAEQIEIHNHRVISWINSQAEKVEILASVCTGALLLAKAGLLKGKKATTHWMDLSRLRDEFEDIEVIEGVKFVDQGNILTAGGISAGINLSFHIVGRYYGPEIVDITARRMEYDVEADNLGGI